MSTNSARISHDARSAIARLGLIGRGLLYVSLGLLAVQVASGERTDTSQRGAVEQVARAPFGQFLLVILATTLVMLVVWKALQTATGDPIEGSDPLDRAKYAVKGAFYVGTAVTAVTVLVANWGASSGSASSDSGSSGGGGGDTNQEAAATVMDWPAGRWIVLIVGLIGIGYAIQQVYEHVVNATFMRRMSATGSTASTLEAVGRIGYAGRAIVIAGVGLFFTIAGIQHDDDEAKGLSGLLSELSARPWGQVAVWMVAIGLVAFGVFSLAESRFRRRNGV